MNIFVFGIIIFVLVYIFLSWFAKTSSKKIAQFLRRLAVLLSVLLAAVLAIGEVSFFITFFNYLAISFENKRLNSFTNVPTMEINSTSEV